MDITTDLNNEERFRSFVENLVRSYPEVFLILAVVYLFFVVFAALTLLAMRWPDRFLGAFEWLDDRSLGWILDRWDAWRFRREVQRTGDSPGQVAMRKLMMSAAYRLELGERPQDVWDSIERAHVRIHRENPIPHVAQFNYVVYRYFQEVCTDRGLIPPVYVEPDFSHTT